MRTFLMAAAVMIGLANATLYSALGDTGFAEPLTWSLDPWPLTAPHTTSAIAVKSRL